MKILHICSYYTGNKLYSNMFKQLSLEGVKQEVFIPLRSRKQIGRNQLSSDYKNVTFYYKPIIKKYDRFLYNWKITKQKKEIEKSVLIDKEIDLIHAHTVFSDGGTAYKLYKEYGINYIINVRNTDINWFYKYALHLRPFMYKILLNAKSIVFISHAYKNNLLPLLPYYIRSEIKNKCVVIPNGIDDYWHQKVTPKLNYNISNELNLLFIGTLNKNKNLYKVLEACALLNNRYDLTLNVIGEGSHKNQLVKLSKELGLESNVIFHGYISDKDKISEIMDKSHIFVMPSYKETFGLVYIEAMSRCLPVIYSKGQGIDGFFEDGEIGFSVDPYNIDSIVKSIDKIIINYVNISNNCIINSSEFNWSVVTNSYIDIY